MTPEQRLDELKTKQQRAGLTPEEKLELVALVDQLKAIPNVVDRPIEQKHIRARITGREAGERIIGTINAVLQGLGDDPRSIDSFWRELRQAFSTELLGPGAAIKASQPMTIAQADKWGDITKMQFGKYVGETVNNTPAEYLEWLLERDDEFKTDLRRYLESGRRKEDLG